MLIKTQQWRIKLSNLQWRLNELNEFFTVLSGFSFGANCFSGRREATGVVWVVKDFLVGRNFEHRNFTSHHSKQQVCLFNLFLENFLIEVFANAVESEEKDSDRTQAIEDSTKVRGKESNVADKTERAGRRRARFSPFRREDES